MIKAELQLIIPWWEADTLTTQQLSVLFVILIILLHCIWTLNLSRLLFLRGLKKVPSMLQYKPIILKHHPKRMMQHDNLWCYILEYNVTSIKFFFPTRGWCGDYIYSVDENRPQPKFYIKIRAPCYFMWNKIYW